MPDRTLLNGPQTNFPTEHDFARDIRLRRNLEDARKSTSGLFGLALAPSNFSFLAGETAQLDVDQIAALREAIPPGVVLRIGVSVFTPVKIGDLIGVKERKYLDLIAGCGNGIWRPDEVCGFEPGEVLFFADRNAIPAGMCPTRLRFPVFPIRVGTDPRSAMQGNAGHGILQGAIAEGRLVPRSFRT
jgi:hypothetical protein